MSSIPFGNHVTLNGNEIQNANIQNLAAAPNGATAGRFYYSTASNALMVYNGTAWRPADAALLTDGSINTSALKSNPFNRANGDYFGSQLAATISDLATTVKAYTLDSFAAPVADLNGNNHKLTNLLTGTNTADAVNLGQMNTAIANGIAGIKAIKNPVRLIAVSNIVLSGAQTIDGVAVVTGDSIAAINQTTGTQNNIYTANTSGAWTIRSDSSGSGSWIEGTEFLVTEGTAYTGTIWRQTTSGTITVGTTVMAFVQTAKPNIYTADGTTLTTAGNVFSVKLGYGITTDGNGVAVDTTKIARVVRSSFTGDGTTTTFTATHNLGTKYLCGVKLWDSTGEEWIVDVNTPTVNTVTFTFNSSSVPANNSVWNWAVSA